MSDPVHDFDFLNEWARLTDAELENVATIETLARLRRVVEQLGDDAQAKQTLSRDNFASTVRQMRTLYVDGSRLLGEAILEASDLRDRHALEEARQVYRRFLSKCHSRFYGDIARTQLAKLEDLD